jgi:hypothetical protein
MDNVFLERLWRSLKHGDIYLRGYADDREAHAGIATYTRRPHQALDNSCGHDGQRKSVARWTPDIHFTFM